MEVARPVRRVLELRARGFVTRDAHLRGLREADALLARDPGLDTVVWTTVEHDGHDPANVSDAIAWMRRHPGRFRRLALVARSTQILALGTVGRVLFPDLSIAVFGRRDEAFAWAARSARGSRRAASVG